MPLGDKRSVGGVLVELVDGLGLDVGKLLRRRRGVADLHVFHLDERGMGDLGPAGKLRRKRDVVEASPRLAFVLDEVRTSGGGEERDECGLHDLLALDRIAHSEVFLHDFGEDADESPPFPLLREVAQHVVDVEHPFVDFVNVRIGRRNHLRGEFLQCLIWDAERHLAELLARNRRDAEPVEERGEVFLFGYLASLERLHEPLGELSSCKQVLKHVEIAVQTPVCRNEMADLRVVGAQILVDKFARKLLRAPKVTEERKHDRGVCHRRSGCAAEAVVVVPPDRRLVGLLRVEAAMCGVVVRYGLEIVVAESRQVRKLRVKRDVRSDVESARHVVHRHGGDARDEEARHGRLCSGRHVLQVREELFEESVSVAERVVCALTAFRKDRVGEVVVLVDHHVELHALVHQPLRDDRQLRDAA